MRRDAAAHRGCLAAKGGTIAIVGNGLNICHPKENKALEEAILAGGGLLLSEQVIGVKANPSRLVARNRLQAALSEAVILAQCPAQSGSLHTMRFARKYGKQSLVATFPRRTPVETITEHFLNRTFQYHSKRLDGETQTTITNEDLLEFSQIEEQIPTLIDSKTNQIAAILSTHDELLGDSYLRILKDKVKRLYTRSDFGHRCGGSCYGLMDTMIENAIEP